MSDHEELREAIALFEHWRAAKSGLPLRDLERCFDRIVDAAKETLPKETRAECWEVRSVYAMAVGPPSFCVQVRFDAFAAQRLAEELRKQRLHTCVEVRKSTHLVPA